MSREYYLAFLKEKGFHVFDQKKEAQLKDSQFIAISPQNDEQFLISLYPIKNLSVYDMINLQHSFQIRQKLNNKYILKVRDLKKYDDFYLLEQEYFKGPTLKETIYAPTFPIEKILSVGLQITNALIEIHDQSIIVKGLCPNYICVDDKQKTIKLIGFERASELKNGYQSLKPPEQLEGNLHYISPEQTGRLNRRIDYRSDLYSLGCVLYFMATGYPPFQDNDPLNLVHSHVVKTPESIQNYRSDFPDILENIIFKLLSKNPEERYQTAKGLHDDLSRCLKDWSNTQKIHSFKIAQNDISWQFEITQKQFGREKELQQLLDVFNQTSQGSSKLVLLGGYSGIGKSSLVNNIHKDLLKQNAIYTQGKYDQYNTHLPYSAFVKALSRMTQEMLWEKGSIKNKWKNDIQNAVAKQGRVLTNIIGNLELLIGKQPEVETLSPTEEQVRLEEIFVKYLGAVATKEHPLVLFLDDLQWADMASLKLLKSLVNNKKLQHVMFITAYRDNEVSDSHPFIETVKNIKDDGGEIESIILSPLNLDDTKNIISESIQIDDRSLEKISNLLFSKTQGNPFFLTQLLQSLYEEEILSFSHKTNKWTCNFEKLRNVEITENVVELMLKRLKTLPEQTTEALRYASFVGSQFDLQTLATISEKSMTSISRSLWSALKEGLIYPLSKGYNLSDFDENLLESTSFNVKYRFLHDRVQQAAYLLTHSNELTQTHEKVGQALKKHLTDQNEKELIFDVLGHLNKCLHLFPSQKDRNELGKLNYKAGMFAKQSTAYQVASHHFSHANDLFDGQIWESFYEIAELMFIEWVECEYLSGYFKEAERLAHTAFQHFKNDNAKAKVYCHLINLYLTTASYKGVIESINAIKMLGAYCPNEHDVYDAIEDQLTFLNTFFKNNDVKKLYDLPSMEKERDQLLINILCNFWCTAYFNARSDYAQWAANEIVVLSIKEGHCSGSALGYTLYAYFTRIIENKYERCLEMGKLAEHVIEQYPNAVQKLRISNMQGHVIQPFFQHIKGSLKYFKESLLLVPISGEIIWGVWAAYFISAIKMMSADPLDDIYNDAKERVDFFKKTNDEKMIMSIDVLMRIIKSYQQDKNGQLEEDQDFNEKHWLEKMYRFKFDPGILFYSIFRTQHHVIFDNFKEAYELSLISEEALKTDMGLITTTLHYFFQSLSIYSLWHDFSEEEKQKANLLLTRNIKQLKTLSTYGKENFLHRYQLLQAEELRLQQDNKQAENLYQKALYNAELQEFHHDIGLINERLAVFYKETQAPEKFLIHLKKALVAYRQWGALGKVSQLESKLPSDHESISEGVSVDILSVVKAIQLISAEMDYNKLIGKLIKIVVTNAGATKGVLALEKDRKFEVKAIYEDDKLRLVEEPIENSHEISQFITQNILNDHKTICFNDVKKDLITEKDQYLTRCKPKSLVAIPLMNLGELIGILYLESKEFINIFTPKSLEMLELLASQASTSINNSRLYHKMESLVEERTKKLKETQAQLMESSKLSALGEMAGGIAHEINNPLGIIDSSMQFLKKLTLKEKATQENILQIVEDVQSTVKRVAKIVQGMRNISRQTDDSNFESFNLEELFDDIIPLCTEKLKMNQVTFSFAEEQLPLYSIKHDRVQLSQVLINLIGNSIDAMENSDDKWIKVSIEEDEQFLSLKIQDNGPGVPQEIQDKIFNPFFTSKGVGKGTGLGLSISKSIIENRGGKLELEKDTKFTTFIVRLLKDENVKKVA